MDRDKIKRLEEIYDSYRHDVATQLEIRREIRKLRHGNRRLK